MELIKFSEAIPVGLKVCYRCNLYVIHNNDSFMQTVKCPTCSYELEYYKTPSDYWHNIFTFKMIQKDKEIQDLKTQLYDLEKRITQLEYSGPTSTLPKGGSEFQKILEEAKIAGDFS